MVEPGYPRNPASVLDGMSLLNKMKIPFSMEFNEIGKAIFQRLIQSPGNRIDIVFDTYKTDSIKDFERAHCQDDATSGLYGNIKGIFKIKS